MDAALRPVDAEGDRARADQLKDERLVHEPRAEKADRRSGHRSQTAIDAADEGSRNVRHDDRDRGDRRPIGIVEMERHRDDHRKNACERGAEGDARRRARQAQCGEFALQRVSEAKVEVPRAARARSRKHEDARVRPHEQRKVGPRVERERHLQPARQANPVGRRRDIGQEALLVLMARYAASDPEHPRRKQAPGMAVEPDPGALPGFRRAATYSLKLATTRHCESSTMPTIGTPALA